MIHAEAVSCENYACTVQSKTRPLLFIWFSCHGASSTMHSDSETQITEELSQEFLSLPPNRHDQKLLHEEEQLSEDSVSGTSIPPEPLHQFHRQTLPPQLTEPKED